MTLPDINFQNIRPYKGTRHGGFEELSVQLFRSTISNTVELTRVDGAGGDGGVEAFIVLSNGGEIGLQAKYFDRLQKKQWQQISKSVNSAFDNHHNLLEYRVAVPLDRTPAQKKKWDALVKQWQMLAKKKGLRRTIKFVWWGASNFNDFLTTSCHGSKLLYWFGCRQFSDEWLDRQNQSAIADLDCRYTPKRHIRTDSEELLDAFSLTEKFADDYYRHVKDLFNAGYRLNESANSGKLKQAAPNEYALFTTAIQKTSSGFGNGRSIPQFDSLRASLGILEEAQEKLTCQLEELNRPKEPFKNSEERARYQGPFNWSLMLANGFEEKLRKLKGFLARYVCADTRRVLVIGPAGSGKSHILATAVLQARKRGQPALLVLGEHFLASNEPWTQLLNKVGWESGISEFLSVLNQEAEASGYPALVCIDALNESSERSLWRSHLNGFAKQIEPFPCIRLLVSCRSDFVPLTLPDVLVKHTDKSWAIIEHTGYGNELFDAVATYFSGYGIQTDHFPPLLEEFQNPLFLKTFCEAFENSRLPSESITLDMVMKRRVSNVCRKLLRDIDCPEESTKKAIELLAEAIRTNHGRAVLKEEFRPKIDALFQGHGDSKSLYRHLKSNGLFIEVGPGYAELSSETQIAIRFPYERFSDYFIADRMLRQHATAEAFKSEWTKNGTLKLINDHSEFWKMRGLMRILAILVPERFGLELAELVENQAILGEIYEDFLASLPWRSPKSFGKRSLAIFRASQGLGLGHFLQSLLRISTIPKHPYNADYLHNRLKPMKLAQRDAIWTMEISKLTVYGGSSAPNLLVKWAFHVEPHLVSNEQALLVARVLAWFFSSNHKAFRFRATLAAIRLLKGRCEQTEQLMREFHDCNDPYVVERVFAVACGVAMREQNASALQHLARTAYETVFANSTVPAHILLRDYARCILELATHRSCLPAGITQTQFRPPYRSKWPRIWPEAKVKPLEKADGWSEIKYSVQPECSGMYGDFGRYIMQSAVHQFSSSPLGKNFQKKKGKIPFDAMAARRWVLQRVKQLGWTPKYFEKYERHLPWKGRQGVDIEKLRAERISKKYQRIALHELQAYLSDHYHMALDWGEKKPAPFEGSWDLWARDFDPSQPLHDLSDDIESDPDDLPPKQRPWWNKYPDPFTDDRLIANREAWVVARPESFQKLIELSETPKRTGEFLALAGHYRWQEDIPYHKAEHDSGRLHMWAHIRSWLVRREHLKQFLALVENLHFWGVGCFLVTVRRGWFGEYPWGHAHRNVKRWCAEQDEWLKGVNIPHVQAVCDYEDNVWGIFPSPQLCEILKARWIGKDFEFVDENGTPVAFSPFQGRNTGTPPCIVSRKRLIECLRQSGWEIVWGILGERYCWSSEAHKHIVPKDAQFSGVFHFCRNLLVGGITKHFIQDIPRK